MGSLLQCFVDRPLVLLPYLAAVGLHFALNPWQQAAHTAAYALSKCLPLVVLASLSLYCFAGRPSIRCWHTAAVVASGVGDLVLAGDQMVLGALAFGVAHVCYLRTFFNNDKPLLWYGALLPIAALNLLLHIVCLRPLPPPLHLSLGAYAAVLSFAVWAALSHAKYAGRHEQQSSTVRAIGFGVFALSDTLLAVNAFAWPLPASQLLVLSTYYAAQLLIFVASLQQLRERKPPSGPAAKAD